MRIGGWQGVASAAALVAAFGLAACTAVVKAPQTDATPDPEEAAVIAVVQQFFDAMAAKDVDAFRATMMPDALVYAAPVPAGQLGGRNAAADIEWLATTTDWLLERMWDPDVRVHGRIAMLWTPYDFWHNGEFSHCGIDIFTLVKTEAGEWKISSAVYTVEREGCAPSPLGPPSPEQLRPPA
jgi:hypothetical protein